MQPEEAVFSGRIPPAARSYVPEAIPILTSPIPEASLMQRPGEAGRHTEMEGLMVAVNAALQALSRGRPADANEPADDLVCSLVRG